MTDRYLIKLELSDGGKLLTTEKFQTCFVTKNVINQQVVKIREKVQGFICFDHYEFPQVELATAEGLMFISISCCCEPYLTTIDQCLNGK